MRVLLQIGTGAVEPCSALPTSYFPPLPGQRRPQTPSTLLWQSRNAKLEPQTLTQMQMTPACALFWGGGFYVFINSQKLKTASRSAVPVLSTQEPSRLRQSPTPGPALQGLPRRACRVVPSEVARQKGATPGTQCA